MRIHVMFHLPPKQHDVYYPSMGVVSACILSFMSKYLHQLWGPKPMTRVDINDKNQSSKNIPLLALMATLMLPLSSCSWFLSPFDINGKGWGFLPLISMVKGNSLLWGCSP
jgi:hypothetical protein